MQNISQLNGAPGMGKTTSLIKQQFQPYNTCYIVPSLHMVDQYFTDIDKYHNKNILMINSTTDRKVIETIYKHMKSSEESFIITSQAYILTKNEWFEEHGFNICHDEPENNIEFKTLSFSSEYKVDDYFNADPYTMRVTINDGFDDENEQFPNESFRSVLHMLKTGRMEAIFVDLNEVNPKIKNEMSKEKEYVDLTIALLPTKEFYPNVSVKLVGHKVERNLFIKLHGDNIPLDTENTVIRDDIKHKSVNVYYFDENNNSKYRKLTNPEVYEKRIAYLMDNLKGKTGILRNNYDDFNVDTQWVDIPSNVHGRNDLMDLNNVIITMTAHMRKNFHDAVIANTNGKLTDDDIFFYRNGDRYFQTVMRSKIRDNTTFDSADIYCMDRRTAEYLKSELEANYGHRVTVNKIAGYESETKSAGRKSIWKNKSERNKASAIVKQASESYYDNATNKRVLMLDATDRTKLKNMDLWNKVTQKGTFPKNKK